MPEKSKGTAKKATKGHKPRRRARQNETEKPAWNERKERAALLVGQDVLTDEKIAADLKVARATLARWKDEELFRERVAQIVDEIKAKVVARGVACQQNRIDALNDRWQRMRQVIEQRAVAHSDYEGGGNTGLVVKQVKGIGKGEDFQVVEEYAVDTGLLREMREHEKQAAIEVGDWTEKREHKFDLGGLSDEDLIILERITAKLT